MNATDTRLKFSNGRRKCAKPIADGALRGRKAALVLANTRTQQRHKDRYAQQQQEQ